MSRVAFRQCDVERALKAAKAVGYERPTVEILTDGTLRLLTERGAEPVASDDDAGAFWQSYTSPDRGRP